MSLITLFDCDSDGAGLPANPQAVAGYLDGGNYATLVARFPHAHHFGIATHPAVDGDCLDVESGDALPPDAPGWVERMIKAGRHRPCVYASVDNYMPAVVANLAHLKRSSYRLWVAHWGQPAQVPAGYDAIQFKSTPAYDESVCLADFFTGPPPPKPKPNPTLTAAQKTALENVRKDLVGIIAHKGQLTKTEMDQLKLAYTRIGGIQGVK